MTLLLPNPTRRFPLACGADPRHARAARAGAAPRSSARGVRWPVLQSSANHAGGAGARTPSHDVPAAIRATAPTSCSTAASCPARPRPSSTCASYEARGEWAVVREGAAARRTRSRCARVGVARDAPRVRHRRLGVHRRRARSRRLVAEGWDVRALARSERLGERRCATRGAEAVRGDLDDVAAMTAGARGLRRRLPLRRAPRRVGHARGVRARQRRGHAQRARPRARRRRRALRPRRHRGGAAAGEPLVDRRRARAAAARLAGALQRDEGAGREGGRSRPTATSSRRSSCARGSCGASGDTTILPPIVEAVAERALRVDRRRPPPDVDDARRQRRRGPRARRRRRARRAAPTSSPTASRSIFREFVDAAARDPGRRAARPQPPARPSARRRRGAARRPGACCRCPAGRR